MEEDAANTTVEAKDVEVAPKEEEPAVKGLQCD